MKGLVKQLIFVFFLVILFIGLYASKSMPKNLPVKSIGLTDLDTNKADFWSVHLVEQDSAICYSADTTYHSGEIMYAFCYNPGGANDSALAVVSGIDERGNIQILGLLYYKNSLLTVDPIKDVIFRQRLFVYVRNFPAGTIFAIGLNYQKT